MLLRLKRWFALRRYALRVSRELKMRFGIRRAYSIEQIRSAVLHAKGSLRFIPIAFAMYGSQEDFDSHYGFTPLDTTYHKLRLLVARRFFGGSATFDAEAIIRVFTSPTYREEGRTYESGLGMEKSD